MRKLQADSDVHDSRECTSPTLNLLHPLTSGPDAVDGSSTGTRVP
jgi:hypothetical protein